VTIQVSNADRVVFPEVGRTKGDVVAYYERIAPRMLPHVAGRPLSIKRYPKGLAGAGFFQKNVPKHYPPSIDRFEVPRQSRSRKDDERTTTIYPVLREAEHLPYVANQGAIEMHVPTARAADLWRPDRLVIDLDPPPGRIDLARKAAHIARAAFAKWGLETAPVATGSKGYHVVAPIAPKLGFDVLGETMQKLAALLAGDNPDELTVVFRVAARGGRVFVDWLRNNPIASAIAPYSLRARPAAPVAAPLAWDEVDTTAPDAFTIADVDRLLDRPDPLGTLERDPGDAERLVAGVDAAFVERGLVLETFDRFRS
jgi:bifunctional non-homologous end joining protein LigD